MTDEEQLAQQRAQISAEVFSEAAGTPPADNPQPEPVAPPADTTPPPTPEPVDEWAGVAPALRARIEALQSGVGKLEVVEGRLQQAERRVGALTNELSEAKKKAAPPPPEPESVVKMRELYPDLSTPLEERIAAATADVLSRVPQIDQQTLAATVAANVKNQVAYELAAERVEESHPGWEQTKETPEFKTWHDKAPADVPRVIYTAREAIKVMDAFKEFKKGQKSPAEIEAARLKRLEQSQTPPGRKLPQAKAEADMTEAEYRAHIAAQIYAKA